MSRKLILGATFGALLIAVAGGAVTLINQTQTATAEAPPYAVPPTIAAVPPPTQPFPYSHKIHAGDLGLDCQFCHTGGDRPVAKTGNALGAMMTFPETGICMGCHAEIATGKPSIIRLTEYHDRNQPVPWKRVYAIAEGVNWSHRTHLQAGAQCETCHGDVRALEVMAQTTVVAAMASCISCHQAYGAATECQTCHDWPSKQQRLRWSN